MKEITISSEITMNSYHVSYSCNPTRDFTKFFCFVFSNVKNMPLLFFYSVIRHAVILHTSELFSKMFILT